MIERDLILDSGRWIERIAIATPIRHSHDQFNGKASLRSTAGRSDGRVRSRKKTGTATSESGRFDLKLRFDQTFSIRY